MVFPENILNFGDLALNLKIQRKCTSCNIPSDATTQPKFYHCINILLVIFESNNLVAKRYEMCFLALGTICTLNRTVSSNFSWRWVGGGYYVFLLAILRRICDLDIFFLL